MICNSKLIFFAGCVCCEPMDHQERLLPSCPSIHAVEAHRSKTDAISSKLIPLTEEGEKEPLLGSVKVNVGGSDNASSKKKKWNWRSLALATVLWFATLFISAAYSMIAPFFPKEVHVCVDIGNRVVEL